MRLTEAEIAFLRRWDWENMVNPGPAFEIARMHGFGFEEMSHLVGWVAKEGHIRRTSTTAPPVIDWPWKNKSFNELRLEILNRNDTLGNESKND
jgi:hypothetical protein